MKGSACFYCQHSTNRRPDVIGWKYDCQFHLENTEMNGGVEDVIACSHGVPRVGFQIGGYYSHMWFEPEIHHNTPEPGQCLRWIIASDGQFPTDDPDNMIEFHICDFEQLERFVRFWREELERKGLLNPRNEDVKG